MSKTVVITGSSSGIGKATAKYFYDKAWNVVATMRDPSKESELKEDSRLKLLSLDVEDKSSIENAIQESIKLFGKIDVLVNNAGYGTFGPLEAGTEQEIRKQYNVNFFGLIDCIKAILPHFKEQKSGHIVNISSIGGLMTLPLFGVYNSSKFAVEGLSEGLWYDLQTFGIKIKIVEPGGIKTDFSGRSLNSFDLSNFPEYQEYYNKVIEKMTDPNITKNFGTAEMVAAIIFRASTDKSNRLRYLAGKDAQRFWFARRWLGHKFQMAQVKKFVGL